MLSDRGKQEQKEDQSRASRKVNFYFRELDGKMGSECSVCGAIFFDILRGSRVEVSAVSLSIEHANKWHKSTGGLFRARPAA
jgi:hypothetical protein